MQRGSITASQAQKQGAVQCRSIATAYRERTPAVWLTVEASVERVLPDEFGQLQHQRFILRCRSGQTVLIVNDVTLGQRVPVRDGANVVVHGQYVWNSQGGLIHFTHHDTGNATGGWILFQRKIYAHVIEKGVPGAVFLA